MFKVSIESDIEKLAEKLAGTFSERRFKSVVASAMTKTAIDSQAAIKQNISTVFDRPTKFTLNSTYVQTANAQNLTAHVGLRDSTAKRIGGAGAYLSAEIHGGQRTQKRFEQLLASAGQMPAGWIVTPAQGVKLNQYGNIPSATLTRILSGLKAFKEQGSTANQTTRSKGRNKQSLSVFSVFQGKNQTGASLSFGVWQRKDGKLSKLLNFTPKATYTTRLPIGDIVSKVVSNRFSYWLNYYASASLQRLIDNNKL